MRRSARRFSSFGFIGGPPGVVLTGFGLFGMYGSSATWKYDWATKAVTSGGVLLDFTDGGSGMGNNVVGVFTSGNGMVRWGVYTFATDTAAFSTSAQSDGRYTSAGSNATVGIVNNQLSAPTRKYVYATDVISASTNVRAEQLTAAVSSATAWHCTGGYATLTDMSIYTYATDVVTSGATLPTGRYGLVGLSFDTYGLFINGNAGGDQNIVSKYTYGTNSYSSGTALGFVSEGSSAAACPTYGAVVKGFPATGNNTVTEYEKATDTVTSGTSIGAASGYGAGLSSQSGNF